jgi:hypothetical protein
MMGFNNNRDTLAQITMLMIVLDILPPFIPKIRFWLHCPVKEYIDRALRSGTQNLSAGNPTPLVLPPGTQRCRVYLLFRGDRLLQHGGLLISLQPKAVLALLLQEEGNKTSA